MFIIDTWYKRRKEKIKTYLPFILPLAVLWFILTILCMVMPLGQDITLAMNRCFLCIFALGFFCILLNKGNDNFFWFILFIFFAIYVGNWFFNDYKKTLAFPLAYIFYSIAKKMLPKELQKYIQKMESYLIFKNQRHDKHVEEHKHNSQIHKLRKSRKHFPVFFQKKKAGTTKNTPKN